MSQDIDLSPIQWRLLRALATGATNKQIAQEMIKSEFTVRNQLNALFKRIAVSNRAQAVHWYHEHRYVTEMAVLGTSVPLSMTDEASRI